MNKAIDEILKQMVGKRQRPLNISGEKFNMLTATRPIGKNKQHSIVWECKCDCGNLVNVPTNHLMNGNTRSCGCYFKTHYGKLVSLRQTTHGESRTRLYKKWATMRERCEYEGNISYKNYGGRGIHVCDEWHDYVNFKTWALNNGYKHGLTIERIDVNGNYEPCNCEWIPLKEQPKNKRNNVRFTINGRTQILKDWERELNLSRHMIRKLYGKGEIANEVNHR